MADPVTAPVLPPEMAGSMLELVDLTQEAVKSAMGFEERAKAAEAKVAELEKKIAGHKPEVTLQKVAFEQPAINRVVQSLVDRSILPADEQVKTAAMLKDDPSFALDLLERVASLQEFPTGPVGRGIPKNANEKENYSTKLDSDPDGWGKVVTEGA